MQVTITMALAKWDKNAEGFEDELDGLGPHAFSFDKIYVAVEMRSVQGKRAVKHFRFGRQFDTSKILPIIKNWLASTEAAEYFRSQTKWQ